MTVWKMKQRVFWEKNFISEVKKQFFRSSMWMEGEKNDLWFCSRSFLFRRWDGWDGNMRVRLWGCSLCVQVFSSFALNLHAWHDKPSDQPHLASKMINPQISSSIPFNSYLFSAEYNAWMKRNEKRYFFLHKIYIFSAFIISKINIILICSQITLNYCYLSRLKTG